MKKLFKEVIIFVVRFGVEKKYRQFENEVNIFTLYPLRVVFDQKKFLLCLLNNPLFIL
jgi:hypothetical protein